MRNSEPPALAIEDDFHLRVLSFEERGIMAAYARISKSPSLPRAHLECLP